MIVCKPEIQRIDTWWKNGWLSHAFVRSLSEYSEGTWQNFLFNNIWAPTLKWNNDKSQGPLDPEEWEWKNYGFDADEVALMYWAQYGGNYFGEYFATDNDFTGAMTLGHVDTINMIKATALKNKLKYIKMIELAGFAYDPLNNVDAHELFSVFENHGGESTTSKGVNSSANGLKQDNTHKVSTYDATAKTEYTDTLEGKLGNFQPSATVGSATASGTNITTPQSTSSAAEVNTTDIKHNTAKNIGSGGTEEDYTVDAKNNAFEQSLKGADYYKAEKHRRYGNIGIISTMELIEKQRDVLKQSLMDEFFKDINDVILIGVY